MEKSINDIKKEAVESKTNVKSSDNTELDVKKETAEPIKTETQTKEETEIKKEYDPLLDSFYNEFDIYILDIYILFTYWKKYKIKK